MRFPPTARLWQALSLDAMRDALTVPYQAAMATGTVPLTDGDLAVARPTREPVLLASLREPLADTALVVRGTVGETQLADIVFAPYSDAGTQLPLFRPQPADDSGAGPFTVSVTVFRVSGSAAFSQHPPTQDPLSDAAAASLIEGTLLEGRLGRLLYLTALEKQRVIRHAREISAMRYLDLARASALDDRGAGLGVPRLERDESDDHYRARLRIYARWRLPTPAAVREAINGPGNEEEPNAGLVAQTGVTARFDIVEDVNEFGLALRVIGVGADGILQRDRFHGVLRTIFLTDIDNPMPPGHALPPVARARWNAIRKRLREELIREGDDARQQRWLAPLTAICLDRSVRLIRRLGHSGDIRLMQAYGPDAGSRYELGLGCDVARFDSDALAAMITALPSVAEETDEIGQLARGAVAQPPDVDPAGDWLYQACGFRTVHPIDDERTYLSPLPTFGLRMGGPSVLTEEDDSAEFFATYEFFGDTGRHVRAQEALDSLPRLFVERELEPVPTAVEPPALHDTLTRLAGSGDGGPPQEFEELVTMGLIVSSEPQHYAAVVLDSVDLGNVVGFAVPADDIRDLAEAGLEEAVRARADAFFDAGFASLRGVWDVENDQLILLAAVLQLPGAVVVSGRQPSAGFRWYTSEVPAPAADRPVPLEVSGRHGNRVQVRRRRDGVVLLMVVGYARRGLADPYEVRVGLPDGPEPVLLDVEQYGYLINLLEFLCPAGIEINTFDIRKRHVDVDGDGTPEWLTSRTNRTALRYRHRRPFDFPGGKSTNREDMP